jgi:hypothetical protein
LLDEVETSELLSTAASRGSWEATAAGGNSSADDTGNTAGSAAVGASCGGGERGVLVEVENEGFARFDVSTTALLSIAKGGSSIVRSSRSPSFSLEIGAGSWGDVRSKDEILSIK